jgi:hypothetical protein
MRQRLRHIADPPARGTWNASLNSPTSLLRLITRSSIVAA